MPPRRDLGLRRRRREPLPRRDLGLRWGRRKPLPRRDLGLRWRRRKPLPLLIGAVLLLQAPLFSVFYNLGKYDEHLPEDAPHVSPVAEKQLSPSKPLRLQELESARLPHGVFYFGPDSHSLRVPRTKTEGSSWTPAQERLLDDGEIDAERERERCASYGFGLLGNATEPKRRRLFLGSLIADDSAEVLRAVGAEAYDVFHSVSFVESNVTQNLDPRKWSYLGDDGRPSDRLRQIHDLFGPRTKVSVEYYVTFRHEHLGWKPMLHEKLQREGITHRWRMNGMQPDDVGILADADETFTRDFLRALQICDVPALRDNQDCRAPKLTASTLIMEASAECVRRDRRWIHPDAVLGKCVDSIGNATLHPPAKREWAAEWQWSKSNQAAQTTHGNRRTGYRLEDNYSLADGFPLWSGDDIRALVGGRHVSKADKFKTPTGYHFHNFFGSLRDIYFKYSTYRHPISQAESKPLWELQAALEIAVRCAKGEYGTSIETFDKLRTSMETFDQVAGSARPIYYLNEEIRKQRHLTWQNIVNDAEIRYNGSIIVDTL